MDDHHFLVCLFGVSFLFKEGCSYFWTEGFLAYKLTQELSGTLAMRGEYWETGNAGPLPVCTGDPNPAIPDTLYRFAPLGLLANCGRVCGTVGGWSLTCKCKAGSDCCPIDGGVKEPVVGVVPW